MIELLKKKAGLFAVLFAILFVVLLAVLSTSAFAQRGDFYRAINEYGNYVPKLAEDLRLLEPDTLVFPDFGNYSYNDILLAKVISGEYLGFMRAIYKDDLVPTVDINATITLRTFAVCNLSAVPKTLADKDCVHFFGSMGIRAAELSRIPSYNICRGNVQGDLVVLNDGIQNGAVSDFAAMANYATLATALKWCQLHFNDTLTVSAPISNNSWISQGGVPDDFSNIESPPAFKLNWQIIAGIAILVVVTVLLFWFKPWR